MTDVEPLIRTSIGYVVRVGHTKRMLRIDCCSWEQGVIGMNNGGRRSSRFMHSGSWSEKGSTFYGHCQLYST